MALKLAAFACLDVVVLFLDFEDGAWDRVAVVGAQAFELLDVWSVSSQGSARIAGWPSRRWGPPYCHEYGHQHFEQRDDDAGQLPEWLPANVVRRLPGRPTFPLPAGLQRVAELAGRQLS